MAVTAIFVVTAVGRLLALAAARNRKLGLQPEAARPGEALPLLLAANPDSELEALRRRAFRPVAAVILIDLTFAGAVVLFALRGGFG